MYCSGQLHHLVMDGVHAEWEYGAEGCYLVVKWPGEQCIIEMSSVQKWSLIRSVRIDLFGGEVTDVTKSLHLVTSRLFKMGLVRLDVSFTNNSVTLRFNRKVDVDLHEIHKF